MKRAIPPPLYRAARLLRRAGTIAFVLVILYLSLVAYSATDFAAASPATRSMTLAIESNGTAVLEVLVNLTDPGYFALSDVQIHAVARLTNGTFIAGTTTPQTTILGGTGALLPITIYIPLAPSGPVASLLTLSQPIVTSVSGNATYATVIDLGFVDQSNYSWGAPFGGLSIVPASPRPLPNGTFIAPVSMSWVDEAPFAEQGMASFSLLAENGTRCGGGSLNVNIPADGGIYQNSSNAIIARGCSFSPGSLVAAFTGPGFSVALPGESIS